MKEKVQQACEVQLQEYKNSAELQGLKTAHDAPSALLVDLRASELNFDGEEVCYGEDNNLLLHNLQWQALFLPLIKGKRQ